MAECGHDYQGEVTVKKLCISLVPIFNHLEVGEMLQIAEKSSHRTYGKGEVIFEAGEELEHLYIVHRGQVKIYRLAESGKEQLIRILGPGDFMGELSLFTEETISSYAEATVETEICSIHKSVLHEVILEKPVIALKILETFSNRLNEAERTIERFRSLDAEKRVASYFIELVGGQEAGKSRSAAVQLDVTLPMSKKDLASYLGMTQETLSRRLSSFQETGWIVQEGQRKFKIVDFEAIKRVGGE